MSYFYLAGPYSEAPETNYQKHLEVTHRLLVKGLMVFSPIVHCHVIAKEFDLPGEFEFWRKYDTSMISKSSGLLIMRSFGVERSAGVKMEIKIARDHNVLLFDLNPDTLEVSHHAGFDL